MKNNNKGAAMITVMIAVMFIGLLATSLVYMSFMNYQAKSMKWATQDNFYYDEFALDDLTTEMQQWCADQNKEIEECISDLQSICGASPGGGYNPDALEANFLHITNSNGAFQAIDLSSDDPQFERRGNKLIFKNLKIESTDYRGYHSTIIVDFSIKLTNGSKGGMDVNDFSIITDQPMHWTGGGNLVYGGNVFIMNKSGGDAVTIGNKTTVTINGDRGLIVGDITIDGGAILCISGQVTVTGNINVNSGALFCTSNLIVGGSVNGTNVFGEYSTQSIETDKFFGEDADFNGGLATNLMSDVYIIGQDWSHGNATTVVALNAACDNSRYNSEEGYKPNSLGALAQFVNYNDMGMGQAACFRAGSDNMNATPNTLLFLPSMSALRGGDYSNTTIICPSGGSGTSFDDSNGIEMGNMDPDDYEAAKNMLMSGQTIQYSFNGVNMNVNLAGGTMDDMMAIVNDKKNNSNLDEQLLNGDTATFADGTVIHAYMAGNETRYAVYKNGQCYVPYGYFISPESSTMITKLFNGILGDTSSLSTVVGYDNWIKE